MHLHLRKATEQTMHHRPAASPPQLHETESMELSNAAVRVAPWVTAHRHLQPRNLANRQIALHKLCVCVPAVPLPNGLAPNSSMHLHRALSRTNSIMRMRRLCPKRVAPRALPTSPCRSATPQQSNAHSRCATSGSSSDSIKARADPTCPRAKARHTLQSATRRSTRDRASLPTRHSPPSAKRTDR